MANRPSGPEQGDAAPEPTQPIDPAAAAAQPPVQPPPEATPAAAADQPAWTAAAPGAAPRDWAPPTPPPGGVRRTWDQATSTTGGRVALGAVAVLATLLVVAVIGLGAAIVGGQDRGDGREASFGRDPGWGAGRGDGWPGGERRGPMDRQDRPRGGSDDDGLPQGRQRGPGAGTMNGMDSGGLDSVLHGEFTTTATGDPVVMVVQVGEVTAHTPAKSITLRSSDGFEGTYDLTGPYASTRIGLPLEVGAQVRVVAAKDGMRATRLNVLG